MASKGCLQVSPVELRQRDLGLPAVARDECHRGEVPACEDRELVDDGEQSVGRAGGDLARSTLDCGRVARQYIAAPFVDIQVDAEPSQAWEHRRDAARVTRR